MAPMRVVIVGAGVVGAACAHVLRGRGADVTVVDPLPPAGGTSGASFAWVNASASLGQADFGLHVLGMAAHRALAADRPEQSWFYPVGHLLVAGSAAGATHLARAANACRVLGYAVERLDAAAVRALQPGIGTTTADAPALWFTDEAWVDTVALVTALAGPVRVGTVVDVRTTNGRVAGVTLGDGAYLAADAVVNAAGPSAGRIAAMVGSPLQLVPAPGLVVRLDVDGAPVARILHIGGTGVRPDGPGRVLVHHPPTDADVAAGEQVGLDDPRVQRVIAAGITAIPALADARATGARVGNRPMPVDAMPSIGPVDGVDGYFEAVMHGAVTLAPAVAELLADAVVDGHLRPELAAFDPYRRQSRDGASVPPGSIVP